MLRAPATKSGQEMFKLVCLFKGSFWGRKSTFFGILKQWKITFKIFAYFPYQKFVSRKQCKITTKNSPYFLTKNLPPKKNVKSPPKIYVTFVTKKSMCEGAPTKQGRFFSSNFQPKSLQDYRLDFALENVEKKFLSVCQKWIKIIFRT